MIEGIQPTEINRERVAGICNRLNAELTAANALSVSKPLLVIAANNTDLQSPAYKGLMAASYVADILDGIVARKHGKSPQGGMIDVVTDHATEALTYLHLSGEGIVPKWVPIVPRRDMLQLIFSERAILLSISL